MASGKCSLRRSRGTSQLLCKRVGAEEHDSFSTPPPSPLPEASAEDRKGFEVERDVEKDGKRREKDEKGREKDEKRMKKDGKRVKYDDYLLIQY